ncbi:GTPase ObgE [Candidatus Wolfebacteria bacterium]|nr:GTPase ObgE [Candidatus Wolfebacteria bacterium]
MLIDDITIKISAGRGGKGAVAFNTNARELGPTGTSGGGGGSVYAEGVTDIAALGQFRFKKDFKAQSGMDGRSQFRDGATGHDLILKIPVGTVIYNLTTGTQSEIKKSGERILLAKGGMGGKGNFHFRGPRNTSPRQSQPGTPGEVFAVRFELKLIADVGFIGLPNAGKSSMLNVLTKAKSRVANYPFTTLEPNLGAYYELILADIPGLIEGSSFGKGLGIKFLRHIERTRILFHFISAESADIKKDYQTIRNELGEYSKELLEKPEYLFLTKSDLLTQDELKQKMAILRKISKTTRAISILDDASIKKIQEALNGIKKEK